MKIFNSTQIHELDKYTIDHEPISSIDLMERAATAITQAITDTWTTFTPMVVFAGPGNNGGDALAVARMLADRGYTVSVYLFNIKGALSDDCAENKCRAMENKHIANFVEVIHEFDPPQLTTGTVVVDGLFGTGLDKPLDKGFASLVKYINQSPCKVVSIDMPSGLMSESNTYNSHNHIIKADLTLTLQTKKLSFLLADCQQYIGRLRVLDIRLSKDYMRKTETMYSMLEEDEVRSMLIPRSDFAHKGEMGHALLIAGSYGMAGAAVLATRACLRAGVGKVTVHTPGHNCGIMQTAVPEAVLEIDAEDAYFSDAVPTEEYSALGIGPGLEQFAGLLGDGNLVGADDGCHTSAEEHAGHRHDEGLYLKITYQEALEHAEGNADRQHDQNHDNGVHTRAHGMMECPSIRPTESHGHLQSHFAGISGGRAA